jgi:putative sigma-54 modulation protein
MRVIVKARHMDLTPALKEHAEQKLGKALMRIVDKPAVRLEIELNDIGNVRNGVDKECRVTVFMPRGKTINIVEVDDDMYKAIDLAHDRLLDKVKREREKRINPSNRRKAATKQRAATARQALTSGTEPWEDEVAQFEGEAVRG